MLQDLKLISRFSHINKTPVHFSRSKFPRWYLTLTDKQDTAGLALQRTPKREPKRQHNTTPALSSAAMVNWGDQQNDELIAFLEKGDIDPHNLDGNYLFGKTVQLFPGYEGDGTPKARTNVIARLRKKLRNYVFDGTVSGRRKRRAVGELFTLRSVFLLALPVPILCLLPSPMFQS